MIDITNRDFIVNLFNMREENGFVMPLGVNVYNETFPLTNIDEITSYDPKSFKVRFVSAYGFHVNNPYPTNNHDFNIVELFPIFDSEHDVDITYVVFESGYIDNADNEENNPNQHFYSEINKYVEMFNTQIGEHVTQLKKEIIRKQMEESLQ